MMLSARFLPILACAVLFGPANAVAQPAAPAPAPAHAAPQQPAAHPVNAARRPIGAAVQGQSAASTTDVQTIGDWTVRCFTVKSVAPCDMIQIAINKDKKQRITSVSLAYVPSRDSYVAQIIVPLGVSFASGLTLSAGNQKLEGLKFRRCENDGCYVETGLAKNAVEAFQSGGDKGAITVALYRVNKSVSLPLSLNGFVSAVNKLKELARAKATTAAPAAAATAPAEAPAPAPQ